MIKLLVPFNHGGTVIEAGTKKNFPPDLEEALVNAGNAERVSDPVKEPDKDSVVEPQPEPEEKQGPSSGKRRGNR